MITRNMRFYDYFTLGAKDEYGQIIIPEEDAIPAGQIKMTINITSQSVQDNIRYQDATYVGLTSANIDDTYIIKFGNERLKVLYVNPLGRLKQVFFKNL